MHSDLAFSVSYGACPGHLTKLCRWQAAGHTHCSSQDAMGMLQTHDSEGMKFMVANIRSASNTSLMRGHSTATQSHFLVYFLKRHTHISTNGLWIQTCWESPQPTEQPWRQEGKSRLQQVLLKLTMARLVVHAFNPGTPEAEVGRLLLSLGLAWSTQ